MDVRARIVGLGKYLPERILTNSDLERLVETSDAWIQERTGVRERRMVADDESASTMAIEAARGALAQAEIDPADLDLIIVTTITPDGLFPAVASMVQHGLGAKRAAAFDINAACVGFLIGLATASQFISSGVYQRVLVVGSEALSRMINWKDRSTCVLFGDGAGAVVLEASDRGGPLSFVFHSDGSGVHFLYAPGPCGPPATEEDRDYYIAMEGTQIFKFAVHAMESSAREAVEAAGLELDDIDLLIPHQANLRIIKATAKALGLPLEQAMVNVDRYGNTSSASIPIALREAWEQDRLHDGDRLLLVSVGGGLAWGAMLLDWAPVGPVPLVPEAMRAASGS